MHLLRRKEDIIKGSRIDLHVESIEKESPEEPYQTIQYGIYLAGSDDRIGRCDLRVGHNEELYYAGNIGYRIFSNWRGNGYAYDACILLFDVAKNNYAMKELIITCSPDNIASVKTCEKLNGQRIETCDVPDWHWLYKRGETIKHIYRYHI